MWEGLSAEERQQRVGNMRQRPRSLDYTQTGIDAYEENTRKSTKRKSTSKHAETETALSYHQFDSLIDEFNDRTASA